MVNFLLGIAAVIVVAILLYLAWTLSWGFGGKR